MINLCNKTYLTKIKKINYNKMIKFKIKIILNKNKFKIKIKIKILILIVLLILIFKMIFSTIWTQINILEGHSLYKMNKRFNKKNK